MVNEYLDKNYAMPLKRYMNMSDEDKAYECAGRCSWYISDFADHNSAFDNKIQELIEDGTLPEDLWYMDSYEIAEEIGPLFNSSLSEFSEDFLRFVSNQGDTDIPLFIVADYIKDIHNEWLVHMTDNLNGVWKEGFNVGVDMDQLAYTPDRGGIKYKYGPGYNFAFEADSADEAERSGYGKYCVLFQASGVEIYHYGDQQYQVIFYGPSAKNLIFIQQNDDGMWCIDDEEQPGNYLCHFEELQQTVDWAINNFAQYTKHLTGKGQPKRFEKNIQAAEKKKMNTNENKTIIIREDQYNMAKEVMDVTPEKFNSNVRYFLHQLLADPVNAEIPTCIKMAGISRSRFIKMLVDKGVVSRTEKLNDTDKDGNRKTPTMSVKYKVLGKIPDELEYKVSKTDFDRKIEKIRRMIFEKNLPEKKEVEISEECGGATACDGSAGQYSQPLFGVIRRSVKEALSSTSHYRDLGGGFNVLTDDGRNEQSLVTIQNKTNGTLYHICFDGSNFNIYRDMNDGEPCSHVSYVFDKLLDAFNDNGYAVVDECLKKVPGRTFKVTEEQMRLFKEATTTMSVGGPTTSYQYDVPFGADKSDPSMKRHNGKGGSVSVNTTDDKK